LNNHNYYLEIGLERGLTFEAIVFSKKHGIEPFPKFRNIESISGSKTYKMNSDTYFREKYIEGKVIGIAFIDGLHTFEQTITDFFNVIKYCDNESLIIIDDTVPNDKFSTYRNAEEAYRARALAGLENNYLWHGDVFQVIPNLYETIPGIEIFTVEDLPNPLSVITLKKVDLEKDYSLSDLNIYVRPKYEDIFEFGIPNIFNPIKKNELLEYLGNPQ
jgi:hypothetical protein